jgi:hypothetical protein
MGIAQNSAADPKDHGRMTRDQVGESLFVFVIDESIE